MQSAFNVHDCWGVYIGGVGMDARLAFFLSGTDDRDPNRGVVVVVRPRADAVQAVAVAPAPSADLTIFLVRYDFACFHTGETTGLYRVDTGAFDMTDAAAEKCNQAGAQ